MLKSSFVTELIYERRKGFYSWIGRDVPNLIWTFSLALCRSMDRISWAICADLVSLLSLNFGWLRGVIDRVTSDEDGSWSEV